METYYGAVQLSIESDGESRDEAFEKALLTLNVLTSKQIKGVKFTGYHMQAFTDMIAPHLHPLYNKWKFYKGDENSEV